MIPESLYVTLFYVIFGASIVVNLYITVMVLKEYLGPFVRWISGKQ